MTLVWLTLQLIASTAVILFAANKLTRSADVIAEKTGLGRSFVGVLMLATATSLPEMGTGVSAVLLDEIDIAMGAAFGSNLFNLVILVFLDFHWRKGPLLGAVSRTSSLVAVLGIVIISMCSIAVLMPRTVTWGNTWILSPMSFVILAVFLLSMYAIYRSSQDAPPAPAAVRHPGVVDMTLARAGWTYGIAALLVIAGSVWLARTGDGFVKQVGLEASFVGTQFLALCTSLPEVATSFAALRMNAPELAVTNVLGSNLFNMGFVIVLNDAAFTGGSIWPRVSPIHAFTGAVGVVMTAVVVLGLRRPTTTTRRVGTFEAVALLALYLGASIVVYRAG